MQIQSYESKIDHHQLAYQYQNDNNQSFLWVIFHGMAEHMERYQSFAQWLINQGYAVLLIDHRGHGKSINQEKIKGYFSKDRGYLNNLEDLHDIISQVRKDNQKMVLFGHSMGSLIARSYLLRYGEQVDACILSGSPDEAQMIRVIYPLSSILSLMFGHQKEARFLSQSIYRGYNSKIEDPNSPFDWLSFNTKNVSAYLKDPLCGFNLSFAGFRDLMFGVRDVYHSKKKTQNPKLPILFISGKEDVCRLPKGLNHAKKCLESQGFQKVQIVELNQARHEWLQEENRELGLIEIQNWMRLIFTV